MNKFKLIFLIPLCNYIGAKLVTWGYCHDDEIKITLHHQQRLIQNQTYQISRLNLKIVVMQLKKQVGIA